MRLGQRGPSPAPVGERLLGQQLGLVVAAAAVRGQAAVGEDAGARRLRVRPSRLASAALEGAVGELPFAAAVVDEPDAVLERGRARSRAASAAAAS